LGTTVRTYRQQLGITQEELAWRADMHRSYLADIERGVRNVTLRSIANLAKALQLSVEGLLFHTSGAGELMAPLEPNLASVDILLVEDNPADVELTLRAFKRVRFANSVQVVRDGEAARQHLFRTEGPALQGSRRPQLVLLDLALPKVSGLELLREMKADKSTQTIPVIVLTVSRHDTNIMECSRLGVNDYIIKPMEFQNFARVTSHLMFQWTLLSPAGPAPSAPK
jgi:CheY-like chemotaxis protein/DNA-binding XRE family transcriptional regulator